MTTRTPVFLVFCGMVTAASAAPQAKGAKPAAGAAAAPTVSVAAVRIVAAGYGEEDREVQPFNERAGVGLALLVTAPGGGLIAFDEDASALGEISDSEGKSLLDDASIWPFPKLSKDGKYLVIEMRSGGVPTVGSTHVAAKGTLSVTTATGSKPVKVLKVPLENAKTFKLGTGVITVEDVDTSTEGKTSFTLKSTLPVMGAIRDVKFLDAKNQPIEASNNGNGRMNDVAYKSFSLDTQAKTVTLEIDAWQGLKQRAIPFDVKATLGYAPAE
jgi:hypothetical protein